MEQNSIIGQVWAELEPELAEQGFELVEVGYGRRGATQVLRLFIDREGGVTIDHCVEASQFASSVLDRSDFVSERYTLEVSSPGIDRPVRKAGDFERFTGERLKLQTVTPIEGRKRFSGVLAGFQDGLISVESDGATVQIHIDNVKKANLDR